MARVTIPARTEVTCDMCGISCEKSKRDARLVLKMNGLDRVGDPVCDGTETYDLCDSCCEKVRMYVRKGEP